jgi:S1-C subfamily serine protease
MTTKGGGDLMELSFRGGSLRNVAALESDPNCGVSFDQKNATLKLMGMTLIDLKLEPEESRKLSSQRGVAVLVVDRELEAYRGGVRNGDIIAEVNSTKIRSLHDLRKVLRQSDLHDPLFVFLLTSNGWRFTNLSFVR